MIESNINNLPSNEYLESLKKIYPDVDKDSVQIVLQYLQVSKQLSRAYANFFGKFGLTEAKFTVLMLIYRNPLNTLAPSQIAKQAGITRASVTTILDGLIQKELVTRDHDKIDRRKIIIKLTEQGEDVLTSILPINYQLTGSITELFNPDEKETFLTHIQQLEKGVKIFEKKISEVNKYE